jgi:hypothetical protein
MASDQQDLREALASTTQLLSEAKAKLESQISENARMSWRCQEAEAHHMLLSRDKTTLLRDNTTLLQDNTTLSRALENQQREYGALARKHREEQEAQSKSKRALSRALSAALSLIGELRERNEARRSQGVVGTRLSFWDFLPAQMREERPFRPEDR